MFAKTRFRKSKKNRTYRPNKLIDGSAIDKPPNTSWVAVPDKLAGGAITVTYNGVTMTIKNWKKEAQMFKRFRDQYWQVGTSRCQYYTLGYFEFKPDDGTYTVTYRKGDISL